VCVCVQTSTSVLVRVLRVAMVDVPTHLVHSPVNVLKDTSSHMMDVTAEVTSTCSSSDGSSSSGGSRLVVMAIKLPLSITLYC